MEMIQTIHPIDYLVIGHLVRDMTESGMRLGGTAAYSSLTARALGMRVGIVTAWSGELPSTSLPEILVHAIPSPENTTFENRYSDDGRIQFLHHLAERIPFSSVPEVWKRSTILHLGPVAQECSPLPDNSFSPALLAMTAQGWLRKWDDTGRVTPGKWVGAEDALQQAGAVVISLEDVDGDESEIERMAQTCRVLAVTEGTAGARLYWNNDLRKFRAPEKKEVDATGAGDIFAAAFFIRLYATRDPWEAARFATRLASFSVTRPGLEGIPTQKEIQSSLVEVF